VGASKCSTKGCDLSKGVVADDNTYTLTIHLTAADPEFLDKLALPFAYVVPASTSLKLTGNNVPPGTGPYLWQSYNPNSEAVLVRNKYFHVWNPQAHPTRSSRSTARPSLMRSRRSRTARPTKCSTVMSFRPTG
jgi:peptide/nickel transport system substrate-binding protein